MPLSSTGGGVAKPTAVVFRGGLWKTGQRIGVSVGAALTVLECVTQYGERLEPPIDARVVTPYFAEALGRLVVRNNSNIYSSIG